jgi:chaperonin GroES
MEIQPLHDRLVVKRIEAEKIVKGGIVIPDTAKEKPQSGVVMAIGKGKILENGNRIEMTVKEGDRIVSTNLAEQLVGRSCSPAFTTARIARSFSLPMREYGGCEE